MKYDRLTSCLAVLSFLVFILNFVVPPAAQGQLLSTGHGNGSQKTDPKDLVVSPASKNKNIKAPIPGGVTKTKGMVPIVSVNVHATVTAHETGGAWRWNVMLRNTDPHDPFPANRLKLKVVQVLNVPNQTVPAGTEFPLPALGPGQKRGFSSQWNRNVRARKLRMEIWDQRARTVIYNQELRLPNKTDAITDLPVSPGAKQALADKKNFEKSHIIINEGRYLGRGAWRAQVRGSGKGGVPANTYTYTWIYRFSTGTDRFFTVPKDIVFDIPAGQPRTILEPGQFYTPTDCDCAALEKIEVTIREKESGKEQRLDINVAIPNIEIQRVWLNPVATEPYQHLCDGKVYATVINHSYYNLRLEWKLEVRMKKWTENGLISENTVQTGPLVLPARQTLKRSILVQDLSACLPHLELDDFFLNSEYHTQQEPKNVYLDAILTVSMPANSKCGPGRPLDLLQGPLVSMSVW